MLLHALSGNSEEIRFLGLCVGLKQSLPVNLYVLLDIKTALDRFLTHSLTRTLDRQSLIFLHDAPNTRHTAAT